MGLDGPFGDGEPLSDLTIRLSLCDQGCHFAFTLSEPTKGPLGNTSW